MHKSWRFIPSIKALAIAICALAAISLCISGAWAQAAKKFVLMSSSGTWGLAQDAAITTNGGTIDYSHAASGLGVGVSSDANFLKNVMKSGAFGAGGEDQDVQWVPPNADVDQLDVGEDAVTPGDETFINEQWNIKAVEAAGAWAAGYTGAGVRVAVIDGGLYNSHIDLASRVDVAHSTSFVPGFAFNQDVGTFWHATHVAGIIAAADNGIGTIGIAPDATIIGVKSLHNGSGSFQAVIQGILYASDPISAGGAGADIINMSLGATFNRGGGNTGAGGLVAALNQAVNYAKTQNVLVVSSAGNNGIDLDHSGNIITIPAQSGSGIAVSATGPIGYGVNWPNGATNFRHPAYYTNFGKSAVWLAAPGGEDSYQPASQLCTIPRCCGGSVTINCWVHDMVMSSVRGSGASTTTYSWADGTSMAAPAVSAVAAIVKQRFPSFGADDLKAFLAQHADGVSGNDPLRAYYGKGFVNARRCATEGGDPSQVAPILAQHPGPAVSAAQHVQLVIARNGGPSPEISFSLPTAGHARLELFDLAGRKVGRLYDGQANAGRTTVTWKSNGIGQGAYFARLTADGVQQAQKIVLMGQ
jgi:subtilisin family serine protease